MTSTFKIHVFDETLQKSNEWIRDILVDAGWISPQTAYSALRAVLHTLRDRLPIEEASDLAAEFPMIIRGLFFEGWTPANKSKKSLRTADDFYREVHRHFQNDPTVDPQKIVATIFRALLNHVSIGEMRQVQLSFPEKMREIFYAEMPNPLGIPSVSEAMEAEKESQKKDEKYENWLNQIAKLPFVENREKADASIKAVLGTLASRVDAPRALEMVDELPRPLTFSKLRGHQETGLGISFDQFVNQISRQFKIRTAEAYELIEQVFHLAKKVLDPLVLKDIESFLPPSWTKVIKAV
ncbi:MAG: hypothetical protein JWQ35_2327 [Bacteriovoracaceae bacterium]|nr:hypothetical protein [Bacteriovoracaceae bacterium]